MPPLKLFRFCTQFLFPEGTDQDPIRCRLDLRHMNIVLAVLDNILRSIFTVLTLFSSAF